MAELGIDIEDHVSKSTDRFRQNDFALVVTVCDDAAENCPVWLGGGKVVHIGFEDPADATGTDAEKLACFRRVRDEIRTELLSYLAKWAPGT